MSDTSKRLASQFAAYQKQNAVQAEAGLQEKKILDQGFIEVRQEFIDKAKALCDELNQEPQVGNILSCYESGNAFSITRSDTGVALTVKFDDMQHKATLSCDHPAKFREEIHVKPNNNNYWWVSNKDGSTTVKYMAEKAVKALLGIPF